MRTDQLLHKLSSLPPSLPSMAQQLSSFIVSLYPRVLRSCALDSVLFFQGTYLSSSSTPTSSWLHFAPLLARNQTLRLPPGTELAGTERGLSERDSRASLDGAGIPGGPRAWGFGSQGS